MRLLQFKPKLLPLLYVKFTSESVSVSVSAWTHMKNSDIVLL